MSDDVKMFSCFSNYQRFLFITLKVSVLIDRVAESLMLKQLYDLCRVRGHGGRHCTPSVSVSVFFFVANFTDTMNRVDRLLLVWQQIVSQ